MCTLRAIIAVTVICLGLCTRLPAETPVIFHISEGVRPRGVIALYGEYLSGPLLGVKFIEDGRVVAPLAQDRDGHSLHVVMPLMEPGVYSLQVTNDGGATWSRTVYLNRAEPRWLSESSGYPGMPLKLIGRHLLACQYNGPDDTELRLIPIKEGRVVPVVPDHVTSYALSFQLPPALSLGNYHIEVRTNSAGLGKEWVRHHETLTVKSPPSDPLALALGVSWASSYTWDNVINVQSKFGARGDDLADDSGAIQNAIDQVARRGGGVVYLPAGTYRHQSLRIKTGVILKGDGPDKTILKYTGQGSRSSDGADAMLTCDKQGTLGIAHLTLTADLGNITRGKTKTGWLNSDGERLFLYDVRTDMYTQDSSLDLGWVILQKRKLLIARCEFIGTAFYAPHIEEIQFRDNIVRIGHHELSIFGSHSIFERNKVIGFVSDKQSLHGFFVDVSRGNARDLYYGFNAVEKALAISNQGEAFSTDGQGEYVAGPVTDATATTVTLSGQIATGRAWHDGYQVLIIKGRGLGQKRNIISRSGHAAGPLSLAIEPAWDVIPDVTSKCLVSNFAENIVLEHMHARECRVGIQYYCNGYDNVMADNTLEDTQGVLVYTFAMPKRMRPSYFCDIRNNTITGASPHYKNTWMGIKAQGDEHYNDYAITAYGLEFRDNLIDRRHQGGGDSIPRNQPSCIALGYHASRVTAGQGVSAVLLENNTTQNAPYGIWITPGVSGTILRANRALGIASEKLHDDGHATRQLRGCPDRQKPCRDLTPKHKLFLDRQNKTLD